MKIPPFKIEEFWKQHESSASHLLCSADTEGWKLADILEMADPESKKQWESLTLGYTESSGLPILREEIAALYSSLKKEQILTFAGAEEGIYCLMRTLVEPKDHVIVIDPCYQSLAVLPTAFGADLTRLSLDPKKQWQLSPEEVEKALRPDTKLLVLNYPHNPTGALLSRAVLTRLVDLARERGTYIFCNEVYRYLEIDETKRLPSIADLYEKGIALHVMTKVFGLAGLRIGWLASQDTRLLQKIASYKQYTSICNSAPSERLALMALRAKDQILKRNREILLENLEILKAFMESHQGYLSWVVPQSGTVTVLELLLPIPVDTFAKQLVEETGVLIMPGTLFDLPGNYFRIGFGKKSMPESLSRFAHFLR